MFRECCALAGALNIFTLMTANLVGFVVGVSGTRTVLLRVLSDPFLLAATIFSLYIGVKYMFEIKETQERMARRLMLRNSKSNLESSDTILKPTRHQHQL